MATIGNSVATLADWAKRLDPDGKVSTIVEMLNQTNPVLQDMLWLEGNLPTGHRTTVRTGLPTVGFRQLNSGVTPSKSTTAQIDEACGIMEALCEVDVDLAKLNGNTAQFRLSEAQAFVEAMNQKMASTLFYGNASTSPEEFTGLAPRYNSLSGTNAGNIINVGSVTGGDATSIWLVGWGANAIHGIFPKGSQAGLIHEDMGEQLIQTATGIGTGRMKAYVDRWQWKCGIAVRDWRNAVRIANIDTSALVADTAGATLKLIEYMSRAIDRLPGAGGVKPAFYMNRTVYSILKIQAMNKSANALSLTQGLNQFDMAFEGVPIRKVDAILGTEATVS
jgi:hypothetical protein